MVADHKKDIKEYERASKLKDAAGPYAVETLPVLRKHLDAAQALNSAKSATSSPAVIAVPAPAAGVPAPAPEITDGQQAR
jgi:hypothetical protein